MPCYTPPIDSYTPEERIKYGFGDLSTQELESVLCGVFTAIPTARACIDWKQVGVPRELVDLWWSQHQKRDEELKRRKRRQL
jgi:hypothetical protein